MSIEPDFQNHFEANRTNPATPPARVLLVGAGPGDPELLTLKALRAIQTADVILYDELVDPAVLELAMSRVRRIHVGKRGGKPSWKQRDIHELILAHAFGGRTIVRLKGGDPFVFGRGGEELAALRDAGLAVEVIPGITAAIAAAASTQVPLTHRQLSRTVTFLSGAGPGHGLPEFTHIDLEALNDGQHTDRRLHVRQDVSGTRHNAHRRRMGCRHSGARRRECIPQR